MARRLRAVPGYVWTLLALVAGIALGGLFPRVFAPAAEITATLIQVVVALVPLLIFAALSPAVLMLVRRGLAGRFATAVVSWFVLTSALAGLLGVVVSGLLFRIPLTSDRATASAEIATMLRVLVGEGDASVPLLAIAGAVALGTVAVWIPPLARVLERTGRAVGRSGRWIAYAFLPVILLLGLTIGVRFGAQLGMEHYLSISLYTAGLCLTWWCLYVFVILRLAARRPLRPILTEYFIPTALFAAGTTSSLATVPVNLANAKKVGVRDEISDFVIPFGAVANLDASALAYAAYAPFVLGHVFGVEVSWVVLLAAWPAVVLFTLAAPGLPAGMGTALWSATLFAGMLELEEPLRSTFIATWIALAGGLPDMFRTATNGTVDGFSAILFDSLFERYFDARKRAEPAPHSPVPAVREEGAPVVHHSTGGSP